MRHARFGRDGAEMRSKELRVEPAKLRRGGGDTVANPHRAQMFQFEFFELIILMKLDR